MTIHFRQDAKQDGYDTSAKCGKRYSNAAQRLVAMYGTSDKTKVTCTRCLKAIAQAEKK